MIFILEKVMLEVGIEILKGDLLIGGIDQEICLFDFFDFFDILCVIIEIVVLIDIVVFVDQDFFILLEFFEFYDEIFDVMDGVFEDIQGMLINLQLDQQVLVVIYIIGFQVINLSIFMIDLDFDDFLVLFIDQEGGEI